MAILIATFLFSCQSNSNNAPAAVKKYSEFTDLEKLNLNGDVVGLQDYRSNTFSFFDSKGMKEKSYTENENSYDYSLYVYAGEKLASYFNFYFDKSSIRTDFKYDTSSFLINEASISSNKKFWGKTFLNNKDGFPLEITDEIIKEKNFWNKNQLDSSISIIPYFGKFVNKYINGRCVESITPKGKIEKCQYRFDSYGNDYRKLIFDDKGGLIDSVERIIVYKGEDLSKYVNNFIKAVSSVNKTNRDNNESQVKANNDLNASSSNNDIQPQIPKEEKVNCSECGGSGQKICEKCYGKGETRCYRCNGTGVASDGRRCVYCSGGYEKCTRCYGKTRVRCDDCGGRGYKNH
jgi:hypothetical protein